MRFFILLALCFVAACADPINLQRIAGGNAVLAASQYSSIATLQFSTNAVFFSHRCGGIIINERSILTAAQCVSGTINLQWRIKVGTLNNQIGGTMYTASQFVIHENYNARSLENDIAYIRTGTSIVYNNFVTPGILAGANYVLADSQPVFAVGWGATTQNGPMSESLRHTQIWTVNRLTCRNNYATVGYQVTDNMVCAGWFGVGGRDRCTGDEGGPLYHSSNVIVGISSFGYGCGLANFPGVYTRISSYTYWISINA